jgi:hypothetical protein
MCIVEILSWKQFTKRKIDDADGNRNKVEIKDEEVNDFQIYFFLG